MALGFQWKLTSEINACSRPLSLLSTFQDWSYSYLSQVQSQLWALISIYSYGEGEKFKLASNQLQGKQPEEREGIKNSQLTDTMRNTLLQYILNVSDHFLKSIILVLIMQKKHRSIIFPKENKNRAKEKFPSRNINLMEVILVTNDM